MKKILSALLAVASVGFVSCEKFPLASITFDKQITRVGDTATGNFEFNLSSYYPNGSAFAAEFRDAKNSVFLVFCDQKAFGGGVPNATVASNACIRTPENFPIAEELEFLNPAQGTDRLAPRVKIVVDPKTDTITQSFSLKGVKPTATNKSAIIVVQICRLLAGQTDFKNQAECLPVEAGFGFFIAP